MTWTQLLASNEVQRHRTSNKELDKLRAVIRRDLTDASLRGASADRRFATAYNAALHAAKMAIACAGYRVVGAGHDRISFDVVKLALGKAADAHIKEIEQVLSRVNEPESVAFSPDDISDNLTFKVQDLKDVLTIEPVLGKQVLRRHINRVISLSRSRLTHPICLTETG